MICIVAGPSRDSKQISFLAINMPHLLRFAQTGINQQDTSQQSPLFHTYPSNWYQDDEDNNSSIYEHSEDNEEDLSVAYVDTHENPPDSTAHSIKPTMSRLFYQWAVGVVP